MHLLANLTERARALFPVLVLTVGIDHDQELVDRPMGSPWHHIFYVEKGEGIMYTPKEKIILKEGKAYFFKSDLPVRYFRTTEEFKTAWVTFVGKGVDDILEYYGVGDIACFESDSIYPLIVNTFRLAERGDPPDLLSMHLYEMIVIMFNKINCASISPTLIKAQKYIDQNYKHDISVGDIARAVGISESLVYRVFREQGRITPAEYLREVRVHNAEKLLLSDPKIQITDVAQACGFSDLAYFCKVFKEKNGISPKKYRNIYNM